MTNFAYIFLVLKCYFINYSYFYFSQKHSKIITNEIEPLNGLFTLTFRYLILVFIFTYDDIYIILSYFSYLYNIIKEILLLNTI